MNNLGYLPLATIAQVGVPYLLDVAADASARVFVMRFERQVIGALAHGGHYYVGFGTACTHMGCVLVPRHGMGARGDICGPCPCHGTTFDLTLGGLVVLGPATQDLPQAVLEVQGDAIVATAWVRDPDPRDEHWPARRTPDTTPDRRE